MDFEAVYSINADLNGVGNPTGDNFYHPYENPTVDSAFFYRSGSWFNPAGIANNWLIMGPVTLPSGGALGWYDRTNPAYRDGYKVYVTEASNVSPTPTFTDFTGSAIYTKTDAYPSPTYATDTTWVLRTAILPGAVSGQPIYIAFNHNSNDMDVLYLDDFFVIEGITGVNESEFVNGAKLRQNMPNPAANFTTVSYELKDKSEITFTVYDVTGKKVAEQFEGTKSSGNHTIRLSTENIQAGVYYYSLMVGHNVTSAKKMVVVK